MVGNQAPPIEVTTIEGETWRLSDQRGKVVLIDLMGVNCPPCRAAMPHLKATHEKYNATGFELISIDMGAVFPGLGGDTEEVRAFKEEFDAGWAFAKDSEGTVGQKYRPIALPTALFVGTDGVIRKVLSGGVHSEEEFTAGIEQAFAESPEDTSSAEAPFAPDFGGDLRTAAILVAFAAGILSFFAPCSVAMLPAFISYYLGRPSGRRTDSGDEDGPEKGGKKNVVFAVLLAIAGVVLFAVGFSEVIDVGAGLAQISITQILLFTAGTLSIVAAGLMSSPGRARQGGKLGLVVALGIFAVFLLIGLPFFGILQLISFEAQVYIVLAVAAVLILLGVAGLYGKDPLSFTMPFKAPQKRDTASFFAFGVFYGLVAMSCNLPLFLVAALGPLVQDADPVTALLALGAYGAGMGLLMIALSVGVALSREAIQKKLTAAVPKVQFVGNILLILAGAYIIWYDLTVLRVQGV